jgi:HIRAN domain
MVERNMHAMNAAEARPVQSSVQSSECCRTWRRKRPTVLLREPDNPADSNAIAVWAENGRRLGYLDREKAVAYGRVFGDHKCT